MKARKQSSGDASLGSGRLLAAIAVLAVAFVVLAAIPAVADDSIADAATYYVDGTATSIGDGTEDSPFKTINEAVNKGDVSTIILKGNVNDVVKITEGRTIVLDLNGMTLTNDADRRSDGYKGVVFNEGNLTIKDSSKNGTGTINAKYSMVAVANAGTLTIEGGIFTNTATSSEKPYANYILNNNGTTIINGGKFVMDSKNMTNSSIVKNGWSYPDCKDKEGNPAVYTNDVVQWTEGKKAVMTINNGSFTSWTYVKNDTFGQMTINNGSFTTYDKSTKDWNIHNVYNAADLIVNGGTFNNTQSSKASSVFFIAATGTMTEIKGGIYNLADKYDGKEIASPLALITGEETTADGATLIISSEAVKAIGNHPVVKSGISKWSEEINKVSVTKYGKVIGSLNLDVAGNSIIDSDFGKLDEDVYLPVFTYTDGKLVVDKLNMGAGKSYISGNVQIGSLNVLADASVNVTSGSTLSVPSGALLSVSSGATFNLSEGAVMNVSKGAAISGSISGSGRIIAQDGADTSGASFGSDIRFGPEYVPMPPTEDDFPGYVPSQTVEKEKKDDSTTQVAIVAAAIAVVLVAIIALLYKSR